MKKLILSVIITSSLLISCKKDDNSTPQMSDTTVASSRVLTQDDDQTHECELTLELFQQYIIDENLTDLEKIEQINIKNQLYENYLDCVELNGDIAL